MNNYRTVPQFSMGFDELIVDSFCGGGGASTGIEQALGRSVDIAINHDPDSIAMHRINHPGTKHYCEDVFHVCPYEATQGRPVGLMWLSPDCKHFSKAKGGTPVEKNIRGLAWLAVKWGAAVKPRIIILENVEEFQAWGPVVDGRPCPDGKGKVFELWVARLQRLGYQVEWRTLRACDYGAPTIRKRLFVVARRDGQSIVWPAPTHGDPSAKGFRKSGLKKWRTAADIIDWSLPCPSIFERKRPLADNTLRRIAKGITRFVIDNPKPFIVRIGQTGFGGDRLQYDVEQPLTTITSKAEHCLATPFVVKVNHGGAEFRGQPLDGPLQTVTGKHGYGLAMPFISRQFGKSVGAGAEDPVGTITAGGGGKSLLASAFISPYYGPRPGADVRGASAGDPVHTVTTENRLSLCTAFLAKHFGGNYTGSGADLDHPLPTVTAVDHNALCTAHLLNLKGSSRRHQAIDQPTPAICAQGNHLAEVRAFLIKFYSEGGQWASVDEPMHTIPTKDRLGLVTVHGELYQIVDIGMRMLEPHELFAAQGFPADYVININADGTPVPKYKQVARCGNSVPPAFARALVDANYKAAGKESAA